MLKYSWTLFTLLGSLWLTDALAIESVMQPCATMITKVCPANQPVKFMQCAKKKLAQEPICQKNLTFYKKSLGFVVAHTQLKHHVTLILARTLSADFGALYFLQDAQGTLIRVARRSSAERLLSATVSSPPKIKTTKTGQTVFVFHQAIHSTCLACKITGDLTLKFIFSAAGTHLKTTVTQSQR